MKALLCLLICPFLLPTSYAVTSSEIEYLKQNPYILNREMVTKAPWPRVTLILSLKASAEEAMALFSDFERQKDYVPGILKSEVIAQPTPLEVHTAYELKMPWPLPNSRYTHGTKLKQEDEALKMSWFVIESDSTEKIEGGVIFEEIEDVTYMTYHSLIYPKSVFASLFANTMVDDTKKSVLTIKEFIEREVREKSEAYEHSISLLRDTLSGKSVFVKKK